MIYHTKAEELLNAASTNNANGVDRKDPNLIAAAQVQAIQGLAYAVLAFVNRQ